MAPPSASSSRPRFALTALSPHRFVLVCGALFGTSLVFLTPPFIVPDEFAHFCRAYHCSQGKYVAVKRDGKAGDELPVAIARLANADGSPAAASQLTTVPFSAEPTRFVDFRNTALYSPVPYVPAAIALWCARCWETRPLSMFYLARFANLAAYLILAATAAYVAPIQKWAVALIALTPMAMYLAAAVSADGATIGLSLLIIALTMNLALSQGSANPRRLALLGLALVLLGLSKQAYCGLALLIFAVPGDKFRCRNQRWLVAGLIIGATLALDAAWSYSVRNIFVPMQPFVDPPAQARWVVTHPITYTAMVFNVLYDTNRYQHMIGYFDGTGPLWWKLTRIAYWIVLLTVAVIDGGKLPALPWRTRLIICAVFVITVAIMETLVYLSSDAVGYGQIEGVQPRYFLPVALLLLLPIRGRTELAGGRFVRHVSPIAAIATVLVAVPATWLALCTK